MTSWCPPLFDESPQRHTKRLFLYASDEISELLRQKYKIAGYVTRNYDYMAHMAWLIGATSAAQALIREINVVKGAWGRGDDQKTLALIKVCAPHMISVWLGGVIRQTSPVGDARRAQYQSAVSSMLTIINKFVPPGPSGASAMTAQDVADAVQMDAQRSLESDSEAQPLVYSCLLLSKALEACGQRCIEWSRMAFPTKSVQDFLDTGALLEPGLLGDSRRLLGVANCLEQGVGSVRRFYVMNIEGKAQPSGSA
jgi:hypothetical protein